MAKETDASKAHIKTHIEALSIKKTRPELFPVDQTQTDMNSEGQQKEMMPGIKAQPMRPITPSMTSGQR